MVICDVVFNYVPLFPLGELTRCYLDIHYFTFPPILRRLLCRSTTYTQAVILLLHKDSHHSYDCKSQNISLISLQEELQNVCYHCIFIYRSRKAFAHPIIDLIHHGSTFLKVFYFLRCSCARRHPL